MKVVILGASGMLGSMVLRWLATDRSLTLAATARTDALLQELERLGPGCERRLLDAETTTVDGLTALLQGADYAVNCIGVIKPYIRDDRPIETERAIRVNALFPHALATAAERSSCRVLQIATDCVYSGTKGGYLESAPHDALDVYGKTKSMGEIHSPWVHHLRCSIIGPEPRAHVSLLDWFIGQARGATVKGFTNHAWNGVTTLHFGKVCHGLIKTRSVPGHLQHLVPTGSITKAALLGVFGKEYDRSDVTIQPVAAPTVIDRTLGTSSPDADRDMWKGAGYAEPPTVEQMVYELARFR
jgi:dTDP-4-dehydrorhamnose reductase